MRSPVTARSRFGTAAAAEFDRVVIAVFNDGAGSDELLAFIRMQSIATAHPLEIHVRHPLRFILAMSVAGAALGPAGAVAKVGSANFSGIVDHVSSNNIKVTDPVTHQSLGFMILPKFDRVFSGDGKTTYQMKAIKAGQYVKVYYDQRMFGARHADRILLLRQNNSIKRRE
jgi:hypothetical protein